MRTYIPEAQECLPGIAAVLQMCQLCSMPCALGTSELLPSTCTGLPRCSAASPLPGPLFFPTPSPLNTLCLQTSTRPSVLTLNIPSEKLSILSLPRMRLSGPSLAFFPRGGHSPTAQFGTVCASAGFWDEGHARHVPMALLQFLSPPCLARDPPPADARPIFVE